MTLRELCEKAVKSKVKEYRYHAVWGNPMWGRQDEWFTTLGNFPIYTRAGRKRANAALYIELDRKPNVNVYIIDVRAYGITIATMAYWCFDDEGVLSCLYLDSCKVTSRTDITILSDVARMLNSMDMLIYVPDYPHDGYTLEHPSYSSFKRVAVADKDYQPTGNYVW